MLYALAAGRALGTGVTVHKLVKISAAIKGHATFAREEKVFVNVASSFVPVMSLSLSTSTIKFSTPKY